MRRFVFGFILVLCFLAAAFILGPREPFSGQATFDESRLGSDLDVYLKRSESRFHDIRAGLHKQILWADPETRQKTAFSIVYLHGYSASLSEIRPVPDKVAEALGANLFFTRLKGHGRTAEAMAEASADDWIYDVMEAIAIGARLGERVIVISTSMGGSLVSWLAANRPEWGVKIAGHVLVSPNFKIADSYAFLLTWPYARVFVPIILGDMRGETGADEAINHAWTLPHATRSLLPMARMTAEAAAAPLENIKAPALFVYSPDDQVVDPVAIETARGRWGGPTQALKLARTGHRGNHVVTGDLLSPSTTKDVILAIISWKNHSF